MRSENEEEEDENGSISTEEEEKQHRTGNGVGRANKEGTNGCSGRLSMSENICQSKTVY